MSTIIRWYSIAMLSTTIFAPELDAQTSGYVARVTSVVVWKLDEDQFHQLTPSRRAALQQKGMQVLDQQRTIQSQELGLAGHWLQFNKFGAKRYSTDMDGYVRVPKIPPITTNVRVFAQVSDKTSIGILERITFVPEGQTPPASLLRLTYKPPPNMNPPEPPGPPSPPDADEALDGPRPRVIVAIQREIFTSTDVLARLQPPPPSPPHCAKRKRCAPGGSSSANAAPGCCLDYNGTLLGGDGEPYLRTGNCAAKGYQNFAGST